MLHRKTTGILLPVIIQILFIEYIILFRLNLCVSRCLDSCCTLCSSFLLRMPDRHSKTGLTHYRNFLLFLHSGFHHNIRYTRSRRSRSSGSRNRLSRSRLSRMNICSLLLSLGCNRSILWLLSSYRLRKYGFYSLFRATPTTHIIPLDGKLGNLYQSQFHQ